MSQTIQKRKELLNEVVDIAGTTKYNLDGFVYILGQENYDEIFPPELLGHIEYTLGSMFEMQKTVMDAVQSLLLKLD